MYISGIYISVQVYIYAYVLVLEGRVLMIDETGVGWLWVVGSLKI